MKIATWNVNSLKVRLGQVIDWLKLNQPDILCLQELKLEETFFPYKEVTTVGYHAAVAGQKTYNGVAILSRRPLSDINIGISGYQDEQKRLISATVENIRIVCAYFPNGQSVGSDKYQYKLQWMNALHVALNKELKHYPLLTLMGDFNVAPEDRDVYDPKAWEGQVLVSAPEREALQKLFALGFKDSFRLFPQEEKSYTWWDYRTFAFRRNHGLRIDHIFLSDALAPYCTRCFIDKEPRKLERPSDHAPLVTEINL